MRGKESLEGGGLIAQLDYQRSSYFDSSIFPIPDTKKYSEERNL